MERFEISVEDARSPAVRRLLERHHAFVALHSPPEDIHALDLEGLADASVTVFGLRRDGVLLGIGALKDLGGAHGEVKSMHTLEEARGLGVAGALVDHLVSVATKRGLTRLSLETGSMAAFAPAWAVYEQHGFEPCEPFGDYRPSRNSRWMTRALGNR